VDLQNFSTPPERICDGGPFGNILKAFPPVPIDPHSRLGYSFRGEPCNAVDDYPADICVGPSGFPKMEPAEYGAEKEAALMVIQSAFKCSTVGTTDEELRENATGALKRHLWRSVDNSLVTLLAAEAVDQGAALTAECLLANAAQYLATNSYCGTGVIYGSTAFVASLGTEYIFREGNTLRDIFGNIIVPSSVDLDVVYAFDSKVEVRTSEIELLDEYAPGVRLVNDRVVRAEMVYTVAVDNCVVASFDLTPCT